MQMVIIEIDLFYFKKKKLTGSSWPCIQTKCPCRFFLNFVVLHLGHIIFFLLRFCEDCDWVCDKCCKYSIENWDDIFILNYIIKYEDFFFLYIYIYIFIS